MKTQPETLRLADALDANATNGDMGRKPDPRCHKRQAAAELRRLHESNTELLEALKDAPVQEPAAYDKTEMNSFVIDLYDKKMQEGKHGHYEIMFHVVHQAIKRVTLPLPVQPERQWVGLTDEEIIDIRRKTTIKTHEAQAEKS